MRTMGRLINHVPCVKSTLSGGRENSLDKFGGVKSRAIRPRPGMRVVIQHARHDVLLVCGVSAELLASFVVVVRHVQSVSKTNDDRSSSTFNSVIFCLRNQQSRY